MQDMRKAASMGVTTIPADDPTPVSVYATAHGNTLVGLGRTVSRTYGLTPRASWFYADSTRIVYVRASH